MKFMHHIWRDMEPIPFNPVAKLYDIKAIKKKQVGRYLLL